MATSPTARTLEYLREKEKWPLVEVTERRIGNKGFVTKDLFGFIDLVAFCPLRGWLLVQTTSGDNVAARLKKIQGDGCREAATTLLQSGFNRIVVIGWRKLKEGKVYRWRPRIVEVTLKDLTNISE